MEEIDLSQLINYFKSKLIYVIFAMAIAFCLSSIYVNRFRVPEYTNSTTILLNQASETTSISYTDVSLNKSLISTYSEIIKSKRVINQVVDKLKLDISYGSLVSKIKVSEVTDTSIIRISVTDTDSELAADIANTIADVFSEEIAKIYKIENISIIDKAEASKTASSASTIKIIGIATVAGAFLSLAVIFVLFYFDTTIKNEEDIERVTGLPVIGIVPISREKIKYSAHRKYYDDLAKKHKSQEILPIEREVRKIEVLEKPVEKQVAKEKIAKEKILEDVNYQVIGDVKGEDLSQYKVNRSTNVQNELSKIKIEALETNSPIYISKKNEDATKRKYTTSRTRTTTKK